MEEQQIFQQNQQQKEGKKGKKSILLLVLLLLLVTVTVGYAILSTSFNIKGESKIVGEWCLDPRGCGDDRCEDIATCDLDPKPVECVVPEKCDDPIDCDAHPEKCNCENGVCPGPDVPNCTTNPEKCMKPNCEVTATETCECPEGATNCIPKNQVWMQGDTVYFKHILEKPGDKFELDVTYRNDGNIDAKLAGVTKSELNQYARQYMDYTVKYSNGSDVSVNDPLNAGSYATYRVNVSYKSTVTTMPDAATMALINEEAQGHYGATSLFTVNYQQK